MEAPQIERDHFAANWPEPPHLKFKEESGGYELCEIEFRSGGREQGELIHFTGRDSYLIFRTAPQPGVASRKIIVNLSKVRQVRLLRPVSMSAINDASLGQTDAVFAPSEVQVYSIEFFDSAIITGETYGFVKLPAGLFLYFGTADNKISRVFFPQEAVAYFQIGDPIGKLLVEENIVSEQQLKEAVEKQQEMRKLVLGDYLIEQGIITQQQLDQALKHQQAKPSLRLGEALIELGMLTSEALQGALARQRANRGRPLGQILVDMGILQPGDLKRVHAKRIGMPFVSLSNFKVDAAAAKLIPPETARRLGVMPLAIEDGALILASEAPLDSSGNAELSLVTRMRVMPVIALGSEIEAKQDEFYGVATGLTIVDPRMMRFEGVEEIDAAPLHDDEHKFDQVFSSGEVIDLMEAVQNPSERVLLHVVNRMLGAAIQGGVLDIHIENDGVSRRTRIQFRNDSPPV